MNKKDKFKFDDGGLLKRLRAKAAPANPKLIKEARAIAIKASKSKQPKSALAKLSTKAAKRILES
jgi:hypothetical protein